MRFRPAARKGHAMRFRPAARKARAKASRHYVQAPGVQGYYRNGRFYGTIG